MSSKSVIPLEKPLVDVGIITIRDDEFLAVLDSFPESAGIHRGSNREYTLRYADAGEGKRYLIAVLRQIEQGNGEAQEAGRDLLDDLDPTLLLVVGIAGGLPSDDITLGDVVLSTRVNDYNVEARKWNEEPSYSLQGGPIAKKLSGSIGNLAGRIEMKRWSSDLPERPRVAWHRKNALYGPEEWSADVRKSLKKHFPKGVIERPPTFTAGPIASSDRLVKDPKLLFPWIQTARHLLAVEMESGGVYRAARDRCLMLAIRGLSDIVGLKRDDAWTKYACASAAAFTRSYLNTQPVPPKVVTEAILEGASKTGKPTSQPDILYANLLPLLDHPKIVFIAPSTSPTYKIAWARLREQEQRAPRSWVLNNKMLYSFTDLSQPPLSEIVDAGAIEEHSVDELKSSLDPERRRIFVQLLNGALRDDLGAMGIWYFHADDVYCFAGRLDEEPRKFTYKNVHQRSTLTVVSHYALDSKKDGKSVPFLRHLGAGCRFRYLDDRWLVEITPTYRFTSDGKLKYRFHEQQLRGIKRLEGNRSVLSQILLWSEVLSAPQLEQPKMLKFESALQFSAEAAVADDELTALDVVEPDGALPTPAAPEDEDDER